MPTIQDEDREYNSLLVVIQTMLDDLDFERENWAYLVRENGRDRLVYKNKPFSLKCTIWTTLIDEKDIEITKWGGMNFREGLWNGKEVDLCTPYLEGSCWAALAEWQTEGHRLMQSLGLKTLTFPMLGHIVRDGAVVGVLTEASCGRLVEYADRAAVYEAVARMQLKGIIHRSLHAGNIFIADGRVKFLGISSVLFFEDDAKLAEMAQRWHWNRLTELFDQLKDKPFNDHPWMRKIPAPALLLPRLPSPSRSIPSLPDVSRLMFLFSLYLSDPFKYHEWLRQAASSSGDRSVIRSKKHTVVLPSLQSVRRRGKHSVDEPLLGSSAYPSRTQIEPPESPCAYSCGGLKRAILDDVTVKSDTSDSTL
ncbi:hypothetical protein PILCRDRAFT_812745 [Piloderma croceum F 1598]|uniref:Uncharacterized protein n=1 Tax=Piloderma croceum (strain F 1598) TaxID=765440 RepID=A0A0C3BTS3_PILCF|nr:hypothetical protein PILCRDRAFT_812745 [Piloderma croceum F 1598]